MTFLAQARERRTIVTMLNPGESRIEKMLGITFASDPRRSRFPLPEAPKDHPKDRPFPFPGQRITPEIARDWLTYRVIRREVTPKELLHDEFVANRRFIISGLTGSSTRKGLVQVIRDGEWNNGIAQGLIFTPDGFLLDGQHRLAACALANREIEAPVAVNAPWSTFPDTDAGRQRTAAQLLDIPHANNCAAIAKYLMPGIEGTDRDFFQRKDASRREVIELVMGWPYFQSTWMTEIIGAYHGSKIPYTPLGAVVIAALACGADKFKVQAFLSAFKKDYSPTDFNGANDPRWQVRKLFSGLQRTDSGGRLANGDQRGNAGLLRRAMTLWLEEEEVTQLNRTSPSRSLPPFWHGERLADFHVKHVS
jgi:hypothetical protein